MADSIKYPGTITLEDIRRDDPPKDGETQGDWFKRAVEPRAQVLTYAQRRDAIQYGMAMDKANQRGVPLLYLNDSTVDPANAVVLTREQARDRRTWEMHYEISKRTGKPLVVVDE